VASRSQLWQGWQKLPTMPAALARQRAMLWTGRQALPQMSPAAAQFQATNPNAAKLWSGYRDLPKYSAAEARDRALHPPGPPPPRPPAGTYDPALDAARRAATRGYGDVKQDTRLAGTRAAEDFQFGQDDINSAYVRTGEDYAANTAMIRRQYDILAGRQQEQANVSGVIGGGALMEAATKRQANQAIEQAPLDTSYARAGQDRDLSIQRLGVGFQRGETDRGTALSRAGREDRAFGLDTAAEKMYQATQSGWVPPAKKPPAKKPPAAKKKKK
jgi:hypothetical protein